MANNDKHAQTPKEEVTENIETKQEEPVAAQQQENAENTENTENSDNIGETVTLSAEEFSAVRAHIETLQKEKEDAILTAQRLQAEFDNYRRRNASLKADSYEEGTRDCIRALLPALDSFEMAMDHAEGIDEKWLEGVKLVQKQLLESLMGMGMKEVNTDGEFDPNFHNAVMQEQVEGTPSGTILAVFQKGYEVKGKIIRHSMVKVAQ